jgi:RNA polymerase sigma-70 factor (family 1)
MMEQDCEKALLKQVSAGDENAFRQLFEHHRNTIYSIAFTFTKSVELSEEIVQDVFLKVWLRRATLNDIQHFRPYLFAVTRNYVYKVLKQISQNHKATVHLVDDELFVTNDIADLLIEKEYNLLLQRAVDRLPNQQQTVYKLIRDQGLKRHEVACQLNLKPETVKFHMAQAIKNIRSFCMLHLNSSILLFFCLTQQ